MEKAIEFLKKQLKWKEYFYEKYKKGKIQTDEVEKQIASLKYAIELLENCDE